MKKTLARVFALAVIASVPVGMAIAEGRKELVRHPNLLAAHKLTQQAFDKLEAAQKANEYDLGGHAKKAKELLQQAQAEIKLAADAADKK